MKKLEIIIESLEQHRILSALDEAGVRGYSIIPNVSGRGRGGTRAGGELTDLLKNVIIIVVDEADVVDRAIKSVEPLLEDYSGIILTSEVILHTGKKET